LYGLRDSGFRVQECDFCAWDDGVALIGDRAMNDTEARLGRQRQQRGYRDQSNEALSGYLRESRLDFGHFNRNTSGPCGSRRSEGTLYQPERKCVDLHIPSVHCDYPVVWIIQCFSSEVKQFPIEGTAETP
jgi:hypothetical protein